VPAEGAGATPFVGAVLAAGVGRRFGRPKALVRYDGVPLVERAVDTLHDAGCSDVVVILGAGADDVRARARLEHTRIVVNVRWDEGMSTSLRAAIEAAGSAPALLVMLVDQPGVTPAVVNRLVTAWVSSERPVAVASYAGAPRNPVVFGSTVWADVAASLRGDTGARRWLREHADLVELVEVGDVGDWADIDTPDDLGTH
jgi:CTP:molybdopterin cytidylyltransferase MocA